jgi:hypothetical protein
MKITLYPDETELTLRIDGGVLSLIDVDTGLYFEINLSESDMVYLKKRLNEWNPTE